MRIISWIVALLVGVVLVLFAISNRQLVEVGLWPLDATLTVRLFLPVLVFGFVAFLAGGVVAWVSASPARRLSRQRKRRVAELEQRIARMEERERLRAEAAASATAAASAGAAAPAPMLRQIPGGRA